MKPHLRSWEGIENVRNPGRRVEDHKSPAEPPLSRHHFDAIATLLGYPVDAVLSIRLMPSEVVVTYKDWRLDGMPRSHTHPIEVVE